MANRKREVYKPKPMTEGSKSQTTRLSLNPFLVHT